MGIHAIKMPDIGEGIAEVELVGWHVQPGDVVVEDQALADVMTDKANVEIPSPVKGTVIALGGKVGDVLAVGSELIRLEVEGAGNVGCGGAGGCACGPTGTSRRCAATTAASRPTTEACRACSSAAAGSSDGTCDACARREADRFTGRAASGVGTRHRTAVRPGQRCSGAHPARRH